MNAKKSLLVAVMVVALAHAGWAVPWLQLDIVGAHHFDATTQTIVSDGNPFTVRALVDLATFNAHNLGNKVAGDYDYYLSYAIVPSSTLRGSSTFTVDGSTPTLVYGTPPLPSDGISGTLQTHDIFPAWYGDQEFTFDTSHTVAAYNTQTGVLANDGSSLAYVDFLVDITVVSVGEAVHFDLFASEWSNGADSEVYQKCLKAPFSHDAQSFNITKTPDGGITITLLGMAMAGLTMLQRRIRK